MTPHDETFTEARDRRRATKAGWCRRRQAALERTARHFGLIFALRDPVRGFGPTVARVHLEHLGERPAVDWFLTTGTIRAVGNRRVAYAGSGHARDVAAVATTLRELVARGT